jgi:sulfatase maturation enzyme AslB (radical SAM superfamily)
VIDTANLAFCPAPWRSLYVDPTGRVDNCCIGKNQLGNIQENSVDQILFGLTNQQVQQTMLNGEYPAGCDLCENGINNLQSNMLKNFPDKTPENYKLGTFKLQYLDARWSNTCNLACVYCSPNLSSTWAQELNQPVRIEKEYKTELLNYVLDNVETLHQVYLAGGEPLLMKENEQLIAAIRERNPSCQLLVNTNLTQIESSSMFQHLLELENCRWLISVDDSNERFEYLRYPAQWSKFVDNLDLLKSSTPINQISFNMVLTCLNALTIWDTIDWLLQQGYPVDNYNLALYNNWTDSGPLDIRSMPVEFQQQVLSRMNYKKYQNLSGWQTIYNHVSELVCYSKTALLAYLTQLDQRRGLNSKKVFPTVYNYLNNKGVA